MLLLATSLLLSAAAPAPATLQLSTTGERALRANHVTLAAVAPATRSSRTLRLPVRTAGFGTGATVDLGGRLRFDSGSRRADFGALRLHVTSAAITLRSGKLALLALTPARPATLGASSLTLTGARFALTKDAATRVKRALKLRRTPSRAALGTFSVTVAPPPVAAPAAPAPLVTTPAATAAPSPTPAATTTPQAACPDFAATPAGSVDWFGCDLAGSGDLRSWTDYVLRRFPPVAGCGSDPGSVTTDGGAARIRADDPYDHRFPIASATHNPDGSTTIRATGGVAYAMPAHGIEEAIGSFRIELAADGVHGAVYADGRAKRTDMSAGACTTSATPYADEHVFDLDLSGIAPQTTDGVTRWVHVPATLAGSDKVGGGSYAPGRPWGELTIAVAG